MLHFAVSLLLIAIFNDPGWAPSNFTLNPGDDYERLFQDEFENVGPIQAIINGKPACAPNPKNWAHVTGMFHDKTKKITLIQFKMHMYKIIN